MCGRYGRLSRFERIAQLAALRIRNDAGDMPPSYNVAPGTMQPVVVGSRDGAVLRNMLWGLVPYWSKDPKKGARPVNAQCETAAERPMFRKLVAERRCLVPADWFYEWKASVGGKVPHVVRMVSREPFFLGGLWDTWHYGRDDAIASFALLTCPANELVARIHDRMPVIVAPENAGRWLDRGERDVKDLLAPYAAEEMSAYPVGPDVNSAKNDHPALIEPSMQQLAE